MARTAVTTRPVNLEAVGKVAQAIQMRIDRYTWAEIAEATGYADKATAYNAVKRELDERRKQTHEDAETLREQESARLDVLAVEAMKILTSLPSAPVDENGELVSPEWELKAAALRLAAIDRLLKVSESMRRLHGLDAATKLEAAVNVQFTVQGIAPEELP